MKTLIYTLSFVLLGLQTLYGQSQVPSNLVADESGANRIKLTWNDNSSDETGFQIFRAVGSGAYDQIGGVGAGITQFTDENAVHATYKYRVRYYKGTNTEVTFTSAYSNEVTFVSNFPAPPADLKANAASSNSIDLTWQDKSDNETGFEIERSPNDKDFVKIADVDDNIKSYKNTGLTANTKYYYRIRAKSGSGKAILYSEYTNLANATTLPAVPLAPSNLSATTKSASQIELKWETTSNNETGYEIESAALASGTFTKIADVAFGTTIYQHNGLTASTKYFYRMKAVNVSGSSPYSTIVDATTMAAPIPGTPKNLTATAISSSQINLKWEDTSGNETGFEIERSLNGTDFTKIGDAAANATTFENTGLQPETKYYYRIRSVNAAGASSYTNVAEATTLVVPLTVPKPPAGLTASAISSSQINLKWTDASDNESGFEIERSLDGKTFTKIADTGANTNSFENTGLTAETQYYYRVRAVNKAGASDFSNTADATTSGTKPGTPKNLSATAISSSQINLKWEDTSGNETGFEIERSLNGTDFTKIGDAAANANTFENTGLQPETKYYYRIRSVNAAGASSYTNVAEATTLVVPLTVPKPPAGLTASAISSSQINLKWTDASDNESGFEIERSLDGKTFTKIADTGANTNSFENTGLTAETQYYYRVRAVNKAGASDFSNTADATTSGTKPGTPKNLSATAVSSGQINLKWEDTSGNETGFEIERSLNGTGFTKIGDAGANATTFENTGLQPETKYYYRIRSVNAAGASSYTNVADATTLAVPLTVPKPPTGLTASVISSSQINLKWTEASDNESGFEIERSLDGKTFTKIADTGANTNSFENTGLTAETQYYYRVRAVNKAGASDFSNTADATTSGTKPGTPKNLSATAVSSGQINLKWEDTSGNETGFEIERSLNGTGFTKIGDAGANATTFENTGLQPETKYYYRIRSVNAAGASSYTNVADATTLAVPLTVPKPPTGLTASAISSSQINLKWTDASDNESGFEIERSLDGKTFTKIADTGANTNSFENTGLSAETKYYYRVRAVNKAGASDFSNTADATTSGTKPGTPKNLSATAVSSSQINLKWEDTSGNETGFEIERSLNGTDFTKIGDAAANATTFENTGLQPETKYYYRIRSVNAAGLSTYTNVAEATTLAVPLSAPKSPTGLTASAISSSQINLKWTDASDNESGFEIERSLDGKTFTKIADTGANTNSFENTGLAAETQYYYRVRAVNKAGASDFSSIADATTLKSSTELAAPDNLIANTVANSAKLSWRDNSSSESGFVIERSVNNGKYTKIGEVAANVIMFSDENLRIETSYLYRVRAIASGGKESDYSNTVSVTIVISAVANQAENLILSPNPASEELSVTGLKAGKVNLEIINEKGVLTHKSIQFVSNGNVKLSINRMNSGVYVLKVSSEKLTRFFRFIKY